MKYTSRSHSNNPRYEKKRGESGNSIELKFARKKSLETGEEIKNNYYIEDYFDLLNFEESEID